MKHSHIIFTSTEFVKTWNELSHTLITLLNTQDYRSQINSEEVSRINNFIKFSLTNIIYLAFAIQSPAH